MFSIIGDFRQSDVLVDGYLRTRGLLRPIVTDGAGLWLPSLSFLKDGDIGDICDAFGGAI